MFIDKNPRPKLELYMNDPFIFSIERKRQIKFEIAVVKMIWLSLTLLSLVTFFANIKIKQTRRRIYQLQKIKNALPLHI